MPALSHAREVRSHRPARRAIHRRLNCLLESLESRVLLSLTPGDISGTWNFVGLDAQGTLQFDDAGNLTGGSIHSSDGSASTPSGAFSVASNGAFSLITSDTAFSGAVNLAKDTIVFTQQTGIFTMGLLFKQTATTFSAADLNGTWSLFLSGDAPDNTGAGSITFDGLGNITGGTETDIDGATTITGGTYEVATTGQFTVNVTIANPGNLDDSATFSGWLNDAKDTLALNPADLEAAANDGNTRLLVANAHAPTYSNADLNNTWSIVGDGFTGSINFNGAGAISGGGGFGGDNDSFILSGTYSILANGTGAGLVTLNIAQLPTSDGVGPQVLHGSLNASKNLLALEQTPFDNADTGETSSNSLMFFVNAGDHAPALSSISTFNAIGNSQPVEISFDQLLAASNAVDTDEDPLKFQVTSLGAGAFTLNDSSLLPDLPFFFSGGDTLEWTPPHGSIGNTTAFSVKAFDGAAYSNTAIPVTVATNGFLPFFNQDLSGDWSFTTHTLDGFINFNGDGDVIGGSITGNTFETEIAADHYTVNSDGSLEIHLTGDPDENLYDGIGAINSTADVVVTTSALLPPDSGDSSTDLAVFLKHTGTFANSNIAGTWNFSTDDVRGSFTADAAGHVSGSFITVNDEGDAVVSGSILGTSSYTLNASTGQFTLLINTSTGNSIAYNGFINSSKDVLSLHGDPDPDADQNDDRSIYAVKHSGTYSNADLFGQYTLSSADVRGTFIADGAGHILSSTLSDASGNPLAISGTYAVTSAGVVTLSISAVSSDGHQTLHFTGGLNTSKNVALLGRTSLSAAQLADGDDFNATFLVRGNIQPLVTIKLTDSTAAESGSPAASKATFTISRLGSTANPLTLHFTTDGTAESETDYTLSTGTMTLGSSVIIPAGASSVLVTLTPIDDEIAEPAESATLTLDADVAYTLTPDKFTATATIADNEPIISIAANKPTASETNNGTSTGIGQVTLTRSGGSNADSLAVTYIIEGSADNGIDFTTLSGTASFAAGASTVTVNVIPDDDALVEGSENVVITLIAGEGSSYTVNNAKDTASVTISDNEPTISITAKKSAASETNNGTSTGIGQFTLTRSGGSNTSPLTVNYIIAGTADNTGDYIALSGSANFAAGASTVTINVVPIDDSLVESSETVLLTLATASSYTVNPLKQTATVTLADNEPTISITANKPAASETNNGASTGIGQFTLTRTGGNNSAPLAVSYTIAGTADNTSDYLTLSGTANFAAGASTVTVNLVPVNDSIVEVPETAILTIVQSGDPSYTINNSKNSATVTLADNEPTISITANKSTASETNNGASTGIGQFTLTRSGGSNADPFTVNYTIEGSADNGIDYLTLTGSANFLAGASTVTVNVLPVNDSLAEPSETVILTLATASSYTVNPLKTHATVSITDNEPTISIAAKKSSASETNNGTSTGVGQFTFTRSGGSNADPLTVNYTIDGTAGNGADYTTLTGSASFLAGASTVTVNVVPVNDSLAESSETVIFTLATSSSYIVNSLKQTSTITITDNEPAISITANKPTASETNNGTSTGVGQFTLTRSGGSNADALAVTYTITGSADNTNDYTTLSGTANFAAGASTVIVKIVPANDAIAEDPETVILTLATASAYTVNPLKTSAAVTIIDNEPSVKITASKSTATEINGTTTGAGQFTLTRTGSTASAMTVHLTITGTADNTTDYANIPNTIVIPAGSLTTALAVNPVDDLFIEGNQSVTLNIAPDSTLHAYSASTSQSQATISIIDHNRPPHVTTPDAITGALQNTAFPISYVDLLIATSAADPEGQPIIFKITGIKSGTLLKNGDAVVVGTTTISSADTLTWTPAINAVGTLPAFGVSISDGVNLIATPVTISVAVSAVV